MGISGFPVINNTVVVGGLTEEQVQELIDQSLEDLPPNTGSSFAYGGELDATPQQITQVAVFSDLTDCTVENGVFTPTGVGVAMARNISQVDYTDANIRFTWPDTTGSFFMVGFGTPTNATMSDLGNAGLPTSYVAIVSGDNAGMDVTKFGANEQVMQENTGAVAGDVIILNFDYATQQVRAYNETQESPLMSIDVSTHGFNTPLALFIYATRTLTFDIAGTSSPAQQSFQRVQVPEDAAGKTYRISNANGFSLFNGVLFTPNDFVTFFEDEGLKCTVSRLWTHQAIEDKVMEAIEASNNAILYNTMTVENPEDYSLVPVQADVDGTVIQYNDIQISINDSLPRTAVGVNFNAMATYKAGELFKITVQSNVEIPAFSLNSLGDSGFLPSLLANIEADSTVIFIVGVLGFDTSHYPRFTLMSKTVI